MRLSNFIDIIIGKGTSSDDSYSLESANAGVALLAAHDLNEPMYIAGTASELYASHDFSDLGVWCDPVDDEAD